VSWHRPVNGRLSCIRLSCIRLSCMLASQSSAMCTDCLFQGSSQVCTETASQLARFGEPASRARNSLAAARHSLRLRFLPFSVGPCALAGHCLTHSSQWNRINCVQSRTLLAPSLRPHESADSVRDCERATHCDVSQRNELWPIGPTFSAVAWLRSFVYCRLGVRACTTHR
jgi:hypothetical protein